MTDPDPLASSMLEAATALRSGALTVGSLLEATLARLQETEPAVGAWACLVDPAALARRAEQLQVGMPFATSPLHGIPFGVKDMIDTAALPTEAGSRVLAGRRPQQDAECIQRASDHGGLMIGKTHTHEFAFGVRTPQTRNPWDAERTAGGSSGGSAAAVAAGSAFWALGTDTLGSVRMPATMCGIVGLKPTLGAVSTKGVLPLSTTLDCVGVLTRTVADAGVVFNAVRRPELPAAYPARDQIRVGVPTDDCLGRLEPEQAEALSASIERLAVHYEIREIAISDIDVQVQDAFALMLPEGSYWHEQFLSAPIGEPPYAADLLRTLRSGLSFPAVRYLEAREARRRLQAELHQILDEVDVVITPGTPYRAPASAGAGFLWPDGAEEPLETSMCRYTAAASLTGLPALSVPTGLAEGLPVGVQLVGGSHHEADLLAVGATIGVRLCPVPDFGTAFSGFERQG